METSLVNLGLIAITCLISILAFNNKDLMGKFIFHPVSVKEHKQWYRLLTSGFLHADWNHLIFNMLTLFFFGGNVEKLFEMIGLGGAVGYILFYLAAIVVSSLPSYFKHKNNDHYYALGASGAVSAVMFAVVLFAPWSTILLKFIIPIPFILYAVGYIAYSAYMDKKGGDNIGHSAHLYGALFGIAFMLVAYPESFKIFIEQLKHPKFGF